VEVRNYAYMHIGRLKGGRKNNRRRYREWAFSTSTNNPETAPSNVEGTGHKSVGVAPPSSKKSDLLSLEGDPQGGVLKNVVLIRSCSEPTQMGYRC